MDTIIFSILLKSQNQSEKCKKKLKLKQPTKYTHNMVDKQSDQQQYDQNQLRSSISKTKRIKKKTIKKQNEPSAIRLQKINQTFDKIEAQGQNLINSFKLSKSLQQLINIEKRYKCTKCGKTAKFYCMSCFERCCQVLFPEVKLPIDVQILHHQSEKANKSSIIPMKMISKQINVHKFAGNKIQGQKAAQKFEPKLDFSKQQTFILYPHKDSKVITAQDIPKLKRIIVLDCTWFQTDQMIDSLTQLGYKNYIRLEGYKSVYWRYNHHSDQALSSAQSLLYFMREYSQAKNEEVHKYDDLMFLYLLNLKMVMKYQQKRLSNKQQDQKGAEQNV